MLVTSRGVYSDKSIKSRLQADRLKAGLGAVGRHHSWRPHNVNYNTNNHCDVRPLVVDKPASAALFRFIDGWPCDKQRERHKGKARGAPCVARIGSPCCRSRAQNRVRGQHHKLVTQFSCPSSRPSPPRIFNTNLTTGTRSSRSQKARAIPMFYLNHHHHRKSPHLESWRPSIFFVPHIWNCL
jgi:hypothetical protein